MKGEAGKKRRRVRETEGKRSTFFIKEMVDLKYKRKKLPVLRMLIYLIILIILIIFIIKAREFFSFLEVLSR